MSQAARLLLINGPNLNLLGIRESDYYGKSTLAEIEERLQNEAEGMQLELACFQSNHEGVIVDRIHQARDRESGIIINPGAFTHTSIALRDAFAAVAIPFIEIHVSNITARESFRRHSYLSDLASGVILGLGVNGYSLALRAMRDLLKKN